MFEHKTIVNSSGEIIEKCVLFINEIPQSFSLEKNMQSVKFYDKNFVKPYWNGDDWIESATDEEIKEWEEENKPLENTEENLIDKLILDNINMQIQIDSLIEASLGGN